jgi:structure-specific recognition protein 1
MLKANEGHLYFLDKQLLFISKLPLLILFAEVSSVTFARSGGALPSSQKFDLVIKMKSTATTTENVMFTSVMKDELESIEEFLTMKKVRVKNEAEEVVAAAVVMALGSDDDEGDDDSDAAPRGKKSAGGDLREEDDEDSEGTSSSSSSSSLSLPLVVVFS